MTKKQVIYLSFISFLFSIIFPILAIAPFVYFILSKGGLIEYIIFISFFIVVLFAINFIGWFNSSSSISFAALNYLYSILQYLVAPFIFSIIYYIIFNIYKKFNLSLIVYLIISAIPFALIVIFSLIFIKNKGYSIFQVSPAFEKMINESLVEFNFEKFFEQLIYKEIPKSVSVISISLSLLVEQHLVSFLKKDINLKNSIAPLESTKLGKIFSYITIAAIYSLIVLKLLLKVENLTLEIILFNIFYFLTTIHFINGLGIIAFYYGRKVKPIVDFQLIPQLKNRPLLFFIIIMGLFFFAIILLSFIVYIYFIIAFISTVDTIYPLRKEKIT